MQKKKVIAIFMTVSVVCYLTYYLSTQWCTLKKFLTLFWQKHIIETEETRFQKTRQHIFKFHFSTILLFSMQVNCLKDTVFFRFSKKDVYTKL